MTDTLRFHGNSIFQVSRTPIPETSDTGVLVKDDKTPINLLMLLHDATRIDASHTANSGYSKPRKRLSLDTELSVISLRIVVEGFAEGERCVIDPVIVVPWLAFTDGDVLPYMMPPLFTRDLGLSAGLQNVRRISSKITDKEASLIEPMACITHSLDILTTPAGAEVLVLGDGTGGAQVVLTATRAKKMQIAREMGAEDDYVKSECDRAQINVQWKKLNDNDPFGFGTVIEATGFISLVNDAINYSGKGGTLLLDVVYSSDPRPVVNWLPSKKKIRIRHQTFPGAIPYGKRKDQSENHENQTGFSFMLEEFPEARENKEALHIIMKP
ncbi:uncharacterized protein EV420DRAFT_1751445 [Desarmillaria tabescens]|uniref:Enoyl reductase (ER) domain-containing protein n=1 Tax=Armillaria tabescens TaxID=1929756 RepID=A0AA39JNV9_ARMTA|nr:uncharacterized protein EV420DRAFT_1751445 [Desarmillaria tabescens]KAK0445979.1 hypothetical protein EV420DRAFT_1751445 [Desarmillaria tabescens]